MQTITSPATNVDAKTIYRMRQMGTSLQQIANKIGRTKERVRQILLKDCGSTKHKLLSTERLCSLADVPRNRVIDLYQHGVITPAAEWNTHNNHYLLWSLSNVSQVTSYCNTKRLCKICHRPLAKGRWVYCSEHCLKESRKYKYRSEEAKQKHLQNIKRYRERRKRLAGFMAKNNLESRVEALILDEAAIQRKRSYATIS